MAHLASVFGSAIAYCLLLWPIAFVAARGSLRLTYRSGPFVQGWLLSVVFLTVLLSISQVIVSDNPGKDDGGMTAAILKLFLGVGCCIFCAFVLRKRFVTAESSKSNMTPNRIPTPRAWWLSSFKRTPEAWLAGLTLLGILGAVMFPRWVYEIRGFRRVIGHSIIFAAPTDGFSADYVHIDYELLATHCAVIAVVGGIAILVAYIYRRGKLLANTDA